MIDLVSTCNPQSWNERLYLSHAATTFGSSMAFLHPFSRRKYLIDIYTGKILRKIHWGRFCMAAIRVTMHWVHTVGSRIILSVLHSVHPSNDSILYISGTIHYYSTRVEILFRLGAP